MRISLKGIFTGFSMLALLALSTAATSIESIDPRLRIGLNLLPSVVAAHTGLKERNPQPEDFTVILVYRNDEALARKAARTLATRDKIGSYRLRTEILSISQLDQFPLDPFHALFMVEPLAAQRRQLIDFTRDNKVLLFSPFKDDVAKGVSAGFEVTNKVLPAINNSALQAAGIRLKAFFKRIAVSYD